MVYRVLDELSAIPDFEGITNYLFENNRVERVFSGTGGTGRFSPQTTFHYLVDDSSVVSARLGGAVDVPLIYGRLFELFRPASDDEICDIFRRSGKMTGNDVVLPFSFVFERGMFDDLGFAVALQLGLQNRRKKVFLINGYYWHNGGENEKSETRNFNIVEECTGPYLVDIGKPPARDVSKIIRARLTGFNGGHFEVEDVGGAYTLP